MEEAFEKNVEESEEMPQNWKDISKPATVNGSNEHSNDRETSLMMNSNGRETSLLQPSVFTNLVSSEESVSHTRDYPRTKPEFNLRCLIECS